MWGQEGHRSGWVAKGRGQEGEGRAGSLPPEDNLRKKSQEGRQEGGENTR